MGRMFLLERKNNKYILYLSDYSVVAEPPFPIN